MSPKSTTIYGLLAGLILLLPSCEWDGNFCVLGYTTQPNYDTSIRTVYVPIFKNLTMRRGIEFDLTRAVVREVEAKTPYKGVSDPCGADTQLTGTVISLNKIVINRNQLNEVREAETTLGVELYWKDLRSGDILSLSKGQQPTPLPLDAPPGAPVKPPPPVLVQSIGGFIPELGESLTTAEQKIVNRLAAQIVSMMEKPW